MSPERERQARALFEEALDVPPEEIQRFIEEHAPDEAIRRRVGELLFFDGRRGPLDLPVADGSGDVANRLESSCDGVRKIGPYSLIGRIGSGGSGTVYLGERTDGEILRPVAIKLLHRDPGGSVSERRFRTEVEILASLDHPHIVRLLDAGRTESGERYLVLAFTDGLPLTQHCTASRLGLRERIDLFLEVCDAVSYAHQQLVVHRDLKPGNVLIAEDGHPRILDFGTARLLSRDKDELATTGSAFLTPTYASPEQLSGARISTASDVYSLGVILFELLTGRRPFSWDGRSRSQMNAYLADAPVPKAGRLRAGIPRDLEIILTKTLQNLPEQRYPSVESLAADLRRFLAGMPVEAHAPTRTYRIGKFLRRNAHSVAYAAAAFLVLGFVAMLGYRQADLAAAERDRAEEALGFVTDLFDLADPFSANGGDVALEEILSLGADQLERIDDPESQARISETMGILYGRLGRYSEARRYLESSLESGFAAPSVRVELAEILDALSEGNEALAQVDRALDGCSPPEDLCSRALRIRAGILAQQGDLDAAARQAEEALDQYRAGGGAGPGAAPFLRAVVEISFQRGELKRAEQYARQAIAAYPESPRQPAAMAIDLNNLGAVLWGRGELGEAESAYRESLRLKRASLGDVDHPSLASSLNNLGNLLLEQGKPDAAEEALDQALQMNLRLLGDGHPQVARNLSNLANVKTIRGEDEAAVSLLTEALSIDRKARGDRHPSLAFDLHNLGSAYLAGGDFAQARRYLSEALDLRLETVGAAHLETARTLVNLARVLHEQGDLKASGERFIEARRSLDESVGEAHWLYAYCLSHHADLLASQSRLDEAEAMIELSLVRYVEVLGTEHPRTRAARTIRGRIRARLGQLTEAEADLAAGYEAVVEMQSKTSKAAVAAMQELDELRGRLR